MNACLEEYSTPGPEQGEAGRDGGSAVICPPKHVVAAGVIWAWFWFNLWGSSAAPTACTPASACWDVGWWLHCSTLWRKQWLQMPNLNCCRSKLKWKSFCQSAIRRNVLVALHATDFSDIICNSPSSPETWVLLFVLCRKGNWSSDVPLNTVPKKQFTKWKSWKISLACSECETCCFRLNHLFQMIHFSRWGNWSSWITQDPLPNTTKWQPTFTVFTMA